MKYLYITGANGFLGRKIINFLSDKSWFNKIFLIVREKSIFPLEDEVFSTLTYEDFYSECYDTYSENNNIEKILLHLAFTRSSQSEDLMSSIRLLENVSEACLHNKIKTIINVSSQSVYNPYRSNTADESDLPHPNSLYGIFKVYSESYLNLFSKKYSVKVIHLRLASLIGAGLNNRITTRLLKDAYFDRKINISSYKEKFSYLTVEDAARMVCCIVNNTNIALHTVYNIGSFETYSLKNIAEIILNLFEKQKLLKPEVNIINSTGPQYNNTLNLNRMMQDFNLENEISLEESLDEILQNLITEKNK